MEKNIKEKRVALIKEYEEKNSDSFVRRKVIFGLLSAMVATRLIYVVLNFIYSVVYKLDIPNTGYFMMVLTIVVAYVFSFFIYQAGIKPATYLALFGGILSLISIYNNAVFMLDASDIFLSVINIAFIVTILIQIFTMLFIIFDKKCKLYMDTMSEIQKTLTKLIKNNEI